MLNVFADSVGLFNAAVISDDHPETVILSRVVLSKIYKLRSKSSYLNKIIINI